MKGLISLDRKVEAREKVHSSRRTQRDYCCVMPASSQPELLSRRL